MIRAGVIGTDNETYRYSVPDAVRTAAPATPQVGSLIDLRTDGRQVVTVHES